jgi:hypothetical protein
MMPDYSRTVRYYGFKISQNDVMTRCIYDLSVIFCQIVMLKVNNNHSDMEKPIYPKIDNSHIISLMFFMILPVVLVMIFPVDKKMLVTFQWRERELLSYNSYASFLEKLTYIGVCSSLLIFFYDKAKKSLRIMAAICTYFNICIQGKRSILFFAIIVSVIILIPGLRNTKLDINKRRHMMLWLAIFAGIAAIVMVGMTVYVKVYSRGYDATETVYMYTTIRTDFLRDDRVRLAIYSLLHPDEIHILDYPGQTIWPIVVWAFPLDYIFASFGIIPPSYSAFLSAGLEGVAREISVTFMTPCIFAELISNLGFLGIIIMPFTSLWFAKIADKYRYPCNVLVIVVYVMINLFATPYIMYFIEFVWLMCFMSRRKVTFGRFIL